MKEKKRWYNSLGWMIFWFFVFFPAFLIGMFLTTAFSVKTKIISIFGIIIVFGLIALVGGGKKVTSATQAQKVAIGLWEDKEAIQYDYAKKLRSRIEFLADGTCQYYHSTDDGKTWEKPNTWESLKNITWTIKSSTYTESKERYFYISFETGGRLVFLTTRKARWADGSSWDGWGSYVVKINE